ncbi:MAG: MurR/RpiR family transcriptional regulator [Psychromonas sp.]
MEYPESLQKLEEKIYARYETLSERLQQVAKYALENKNSIAFNTIVVIAQEADVPPSTLIRFAKTFGYQGFNNIRNVFRTSLLSDTPNYQDRLRLAKKLDRKKGLRESPAKLLHEFAFASSRSLLDLMDNISEQDLNKALDMLTDAQNIFVIGLGRSFGLASYFNYSLNHLNLSSHLVNGLGSMQVEQLEMMAEGDVLIAISFSPYTPETLVACEMAASKGARLLLITDHYISPIATLSDTCLVVKEVPVKDAFRTLSATQCLIQSLCVSLIYQEQANSN